MKKIKKLWASVHKPLPEQGEGWEFLPSEIQDRLNNCPADAEQLRQLAYELISYARTHQADIYQPGGSPAFQNVLGQALKETGRSLLYGCPVVYYAHSIRESIEETLPDGSVKKTAVFKHRGWIAV